MWPGFRKSVRARLADDRGKEVPVFDWTAAPPAVKDDPQLAGIQARLQSLRNPGLFSPMTRSAAAVTGVVALLPLLLVFVASRTGLPPWTAFALTGLGSSALTLSFLRREFRAETVPLLLARERCASCGYTIAGAPRQSDGCVICPECGAAWKGSRVGTQQVPGRIQRFASPLQASSTIVDDRPMRIDAQDRFVPLPSREELHQLARRQDTLGECARAARGRQRWIAVGALVLAGFAAWWVIVPFRAAVPLVWGWNGDTVTWICMAVVTVGLVVHRARWVYSALLGTTSSGTRAVVRAFVSRRFCPSCRGSLNSNTTTPAGNLLCRGCNAAWPAREIDL